MLDNLNQDVSILQPSLQMTDSQVQNRIRQMKMEDPEEQTCYQKFCNLFTIEYYREYFDVTVEMPRLIQIFLKFFVSTLVFHLCFPKNPSLFFQFQIHSFNLIINYQFLIQFH